MPRSRVLRALPFAVAVGLLSSGLAVSPAAAAPGDDVLLFSNPSVVDAAAGAEYERLSAAITAAGYNVTAFDGGDGQASTWESALVGMEVFVLPEQEGSHVYDPASPPAWMSTAAKDVLVDWVRDGGSMLFNGTCENDQAGAGHILSDAVGVDYSGVLGDCHEPGTSERWIDDGTLPAQLPYANGTYAMLLSEFSPEQLAPLTVWYSYAGGCGEQLTVGEFAAGDGRIAFDGWDYYDHGDSANEAQWNQVLASLLNGNATASTWAPAEPVVKDPVTAETDSDELMFSISQDDCSDETSVYRVDPGTGDAAPTGSAPIDGFAGQGAWDSVSETAFLPFYDDDSGDDMLATIDPETGEISFVEEFQSVENLYEIYSLAIGTDGAAYVFAVYEGDSGDTLGLFALDLETAVLTHITDVDEALLDDPNGFAVDPTTGEFYAFEEDTHELFRVDVSTGALTPLGWLDAPSIDSDSDVTALQIGQDGTFWVVFDAEIDVDVYGGVLARFTLDDIVSGDIEADEVGPFDEPMESYSLLLTPAPAALPATGAGVHGGAAGAAVALLALGMVIVAARSRRRVA